ncbi:probable prolyl 4-hydroxylase 3 [Vigna angularis]|nr:probable prolyl 4-hydroxylase 3 [Vigna angularis]
MKPNDNVPILTKTDSEVSSLSQSSPPRSPRRPVYYIQSPSHESASTRFSGSRKSSSTNHMGPWRPWKDHFLYSCYSSPFRMGVKIRRIFLLLKNLFNAFDEIMTWEVHGANGNTGGPSRFLIYYCLNLSYSENGEGLQILHYEVGQKYEPHYDYFLDEFNTRNGGQRIATVLMYLSDVEEGGETVFPTAIANFSSVPWWNDLSQCARKGLSVKPKRGDALLFWSMRPDASLDPSSLHGGCPVIKGNKWSSTKWMHLHEYKV